MSKDFVTVRGVIRMPEDIPREEREVLLPCDDIEDRYPIRYPAPKDPYGYFITENAK